MPELECRHETFVDSCPACAELALIAEAFVDERDRLMQDAAVPSSAIV